MNLSRSGYLLNKSGDNRVCTAQIRGEKVNSRRLNGANEAYGGNESRKSHTRDITLFFFFFFSQQKTFSKFSKPRLRSTVDRVNTILLASMKKKEKISHRILESNFLFFKILSLYSYPRWINFCQKNYISFNYFSNIIF